MKKPKKIKLSATIKPQTHSYKFEFSAQFSDKLLNFTPPIMEIKGAVSGDSTVGAMPLIFII